MPRPLSAVARLEQKLIALLASDALAPDAPLPTTRQLAEENGLSNATVHRLLRKLHEAGLLWRHENGRYYAPAAREVLEKAHPVACLLRQLQNWAFAYQGVMAGVSAACGAAGRSMILTHNEALVTHEDTRFPPRFGSTTTQDAALGHFLDNHREPLHGFILDHLWHDEVIARHESRLTRVVLVNRATPLPFAGSVSPDYRLGASVGVGHLALQGYRKMIPVLPFEGDAFTDLFLDAFEAAAQAIGVPLSPSDRRRATTDEERAALVTEVLAEEVPVALFCPEINVATLLYRKLRGSRVALMAAGNEAAARAEGITSLRVPFEEIGAEAVRLLDQTPPVQRVLPVTLFQGGSTPAFGS